MSNQPPEYTRQYNFENFQSLNPTTPLPGNKVEAELNAARSSINQTISRLNEIQNADGSLKTPDALAAETTATATSVATSVATSTAQAYLTSNYDPTIASQAAASASDAAAWATDAANSKQAAQANMVNAEAAAGLAQNAAIDSAIARSEARGHALDANESRNEAHASAQAAAASYADVGQVYGSALSLKNWIDSQSYQFVHKREDTSSVAANMLFNEGDVSNTLIGKIFNGAQVDSNSVITHPGPINNTGYNFLNGPWWVVGNPSPENPEVIIMRDMMNCLVQTWKAFGPSVTRGDMKAMEPGVNGQPDQLWNVLDYNGKLIEPIVYSQSDFNANQISHPEIQKAALTPKGYVDQKDAEVMSAAQQASSTADTARAEVQQFRTSEYDNGRVYGPFEIVKFGSKLYWFKAFIGAAGYAPDTHPAAWTELSPQVDVSGFATENFVTSQGYLTAVPAGYATESWVTSQGYITSSALTPYAPLANPNFTGVAKFVNPGNYGIVLDDPLSPGYNTSIGMQSIAITQGGPSGENITVGFDGFKRSSGSQYYGLLGVTALQIANPAGSIVLDYTYGLSKDGVELYARKSGDFFTGKVNFATISSSSPSINLGGQCDPAPASAVNGDLWISNATSPKITYRSGGVNYNVPVLNQFNTFTGQVVVDTTSASVPALRVTQRGTGEALRVEDSTTPDATSFIVGNDGKVGIGVNAINTAYALEAVGNVKADGFVSGTGPVFKVNAVQSHSGGSDTHELLMSINGSTYKIGMSFVSTP